MIATLNNEKLKQTFIENMLNKDYKNEEVKQVSQRTIEEDEKDVDEENNKEKGKYSINDNEYNHLFEDDMNYDLSTLMESNSSDEYSIEFILMYVNDDLKIPFCQYFFEEINNEMVLPKIVINKTKIQELSKNYNKDSEYDAKHYLFIDQITKALKTNYNINTQQVNYRGYSVNKSKIYVLCHIRQTLFDYGYMAIYDELVSGQEIQQVPVNQENLSFFKENVNIQQLIDINGNMIDVPLHGYLCNYENNELINIESSNMFEDMINHNTFGLNYVFSEYLLDEDNENNKRYKKYAIFVNDVLFKSEDVSKLPLMQSGGDKKSEDYDEYSSIYYHDGISRTFILVKNYEQFCIIE